MPNLPNRCQHLKVNGTLCGSPPLRRKRFCYFHKLHHEETIQLKQGTALAAPCNTAFTHFPCSKTPTPFKSRSCKSCAFIIAGQIEGKTAGLLLYALQTASSNLPRTNFQPYLHDVVLDVETVNRTPLNSQIWREDDFAGDEEEDEPEEDFIPQSPRGRAALPRDPTVQPHAKRPPAKPTSGRSQKKVTAQIKQALPAIAAAVAANGGH